MGRPIVLPGPAELKELPTLDDLATVTDEASYAALVDKYLADPKLNRQLLSFFQDQMKLGVPGNPIATPPTPSGFTAPTYATALAVRDVDFRMVFTATAGTCPTMDMTTYAITDADCPVANGLTDAVDAATGEVLTGDATAVKNGFRSRIEACDTLEALHALWPDVQAIE